MQNYLRRFQTTEDYEDFKESEDYIEPNVSICKDTGSVMYNQAETNNGILKFKSFSVSTIKLVVGSGSPAAISLQYSKDNGDTWMPYTIGDTIDLGVLDTVMLKGNNSSFSSSATNYYKFQMTGSVAASGDVTSLLNGVGGDVDLSTNNITFTSLFMNCTALTQAPELPATTLAEECYHGMFSSCTSLTKAPELPATTLVTNCYGNMFNGCTNLNYIKAMFTTTPGSLYTGRWVAGVASTGTFVKNSAAEWDVTGEHGVPSGWTVQTAS